MGESPGLFPPGATHSLTGCPPWGRSDGSKFLVSYSVKELKKPTKNSKTEKSFIQNRTKHGYMPVYKLKSSWVLPWASSRKSRKRRRSWLLGGKVWVIPCV